MNRETELPMEVRIAQELIPAIEKASTATGYDGTVRSIDSLYGYLANGGKIDDKTKVDLLRALSEWTRIQKLNFTTGLNIIKMLEKKSPDDSGLTQTVHSENDGVSIEESKGLTEQ